MSESEDDAELSHSHDTPITAPQTPCSLRRSDIKKLPCPFDSCPKTFNRQARLDEHLRSHNNDRPFKCLHPGCGKNFLRNTHLKRHIKSAHSNIRDYTCSWAGCEKSFSTGTRLRRHEEAHLGREKYQCTGYDNCNQTFRKHDTLRRHIMSVHEHMRPFPCQDTDLKTGHPCSQAFETAERLRAHQRAKHDRAKFACSSCLEQKPEPVGSVVEDSDGLPDRISNNCYFATYGELQSHIAAAHPPICNYCPTLFRTPKELSRHLELQHGLVDGSNSKAVTQRYTCSYPACGRAFTKTGNLNVHIKTVHEKRRDFVCGQTDISLPTDIDSGVVIHGCGRDFTSKASLEEHIRTAHLGLLSKRLERKKRRQTQSTEDLSQDDKEFEAPRRRKRRKDRGVKKVSMLSSLLSGPFAPQQRPADFTVYAEDEHDAATDQTQPLSSSMTMYGSQIFHHDSGRHDQTLPLNLQTNYHENLSEDDFDDGDDGDGIFGDFERELDGPFPHTPVDPLLFHL